MKNCESCQSRAILLLTLSSLDRAEVLSKRLRDAAETCIDELKAEIERTRLSCRDEESWRYGEKEDWMADLD